MRIRSSTLLRLWAFALLIVASNTMFAANWYVKTTGNNANNGSTWATAKASIQEMVSSSNVSNGDIIFIEGGIYTEQVVIGNKSLTLLGSQNGLGRTEIASPAYTALTAYTFGIALSWNGSGKLSGNAIRPVVFVNATSSSVSVNIEQIDITGTNASMPEASTDVLVGLAYRYASGTVGGSGTKNVTISNFNANSTASGLNNAFGAMILTRSSVTLSHVKIQNYRNAGIAVVGENLSTASSIIANQPNPTIIDCEVKGKTINSVSSGNFIQSGILIANGARATVKRTLVWNNRTNGANNATDRFAYGVYLNDARSALIGESSTLKANGNLITDNEIGIYVRINSTSVSASGYTIRQNTIAYNGNETPSGRIAPYGSETAQNTTYGAIRFNHAPVTNQTLAVTNNAWGNSEAHLFFSANATSADYLPAAYDGNRVAFWNQDKGDQITFSLPLSPLYADTLYVHEDNSPISQPAAASPHGIGLNLEFGYHNFSQLNRAVYAAREQAGTGNTPNIYVKSDTEEEETAVITKSINILGDSAACGSQSTIQLAGSLNMPIVWAYGLNTQSAGPNNNSDALTRTPNGITLKFLNFGPNNVQSSGSASTGPAMLVTGASGGSNTPTNVQLYSCAMAPEFDGSPLAISTDQDGTLTGRYSAAPVTIDARFTKKSNNCDLLLVDNDVRDNRDNTTLSLVLLDDVFEISSGNCADLQNRIDIASLTSPRTTIRILANMGPCVINANTTAKVRIETIAPATLDISVFNLNNGGGLGGNIAVCGMEVNTESSGITTIARVNVWPPACLNDAANIVTDNPSHVVVAANSNAVVGALAFRESLVDSMNYVILQKRFDMSVATGATAINPTPSPTNQTFTGRFIVQDRLQHDGVLLGFADVPVIAGTMYSTNGTTFGSDPVQVEMKHSRLNFDLSNYDFHYAIPFYGGSIEMAQQFINPTSGSRRMNFTNPTFNEFSSENARIYKRVFVDGLANRGTQTGTIRLDGSGNCLASGVDASSVLRNLSTTNIVVVNLTDCIQTALGRVVDCDISNQNIEGVGTNSSNGSGGTVDIAPALAAGDFNQNLEIAKSVILNEAASVSLGNGALTLRRGAVVSGSASFFARNVVMTQCFPAHNPGFPANPSMVEAMTLVGTGPGNTITLTGYGNTNGVAVAGNSPRGVWHFDNITVNRHVEIKGTNANVSSNLLTTDCSLLSSSSFPGVNAARNLAIETVIGGEGTNAYVSAGDKIFNIVNSGASINGISFRNIIGSGLQTAVWINAGLNDVSVLNNILNSNWANSFGLVQNDISGAPLSNIDVKNNHILVTLGAMGAPISLGNLNNASGQNEIIGNAANVQNAGTGVVMWLQSVNGSSSTGTLVSNNWFRGGTSHGIFMLTNAVGLNGITVEKNRLSNGFGQGLEINVSGIDPGSNGITVKENIIGDQGNGIVLSGNYSAMTVNRIFINSNDLSGNTNGVNIAGTTDITDPNTNMFDLRFNWWGSDLGPQRGSVIATNPLLAPTDSSRIIGHVPFNHTSGSFIVDANGASHGRWRLYPVAVDNEDGTIGGTCGWQVKNMMGPVLRLNAAGNTLLGMYNTIANGRDNASALAYPAVTGARTGTDQLVIVAGTTYNATSYGYDGSSNESSYPVQFTADPQPSIIRGLNRPRIRANLAGTGSIQVTSAFPRAFELRDFVEHVGQSPNYTAISFANGFGNTVDYNFITALNAAPTTFKGITCTNSAPGVVQTFTNNRINLGQNPRWPGSGIIPLSAPSEFTGIEVPSHGGNGSVNISNNEVSTGATAGATKSVGIWVNAQNNIINSLTVSGNQIRNMSAASGVVSTRSSIWGTGIYISGGNNLTVNANNIQGGNSGGGKGHDGITLDATGIGTIGSAGNGNVISTNAGMNLVGVNTGTTRERGYGIKVFSASGTAPLGRLFIGFNTIGSSAATAPDVASIYVGGTSGTIGSAGNAINIDNNTIKNGTATQNAVVQIATSQYSETSSEGYVRIGSNTIGSITPGQSNAMFLAIGTTGIGTGRTNSANNIAVSVQGNAVRTSAQTIGGSTLEVADARTNAGANIRDIFGFGVGSAINGAITPGNGNSGNNTFTHATILTSEPNHANYTYYSSALKRTANAVSLGNPAATPVTIQRLIATPLAVAGQADSANTVELRESAGWAVGSEDLYYKEQLTFPDRRVLVSGPRSSYAELLPGIGGTGVMFTSNGRENKDIRGAISINAVSAGMYGQVSVGAANKGDVYLQLNTIGSDFAPVSFRYDAATLASVSVVGGLNNSLTRALDIKSGMDDADDDGFIANASTTRRTGVFRSGSATQFLKGNNNAITGTSPLNVFPNPASGDVTVAFTVPFEGMVRVALFNALGEKVTDLREENLSADSYTTSFSAAGLPSGTYLVRLVHDLYTLTTPVTVIK